VSAGALSFCFEGNIMANEDWLYSVGVNTQTADNALRDFVARTTKTLATIPVLTLRANTGVATGTIDTFVRNAKSVLSSGMATTVTVDTTKAQAQISELKASMRGLGAEAKTSLGGIQVGSGGAVSGMASLTNSVKSQTAALDFMNKAWSYSLLKFAEYEIIAKSIEGVIHEVTDSLKQASDVQFEQSLQKLYSPEVFNSIQKQNDALNSATIIAKQWGSDIRDVLQVQGLWTKNTNDLATAQFLAAKSEEMHRASGIETLEVYRTTTAMLAQMGMSGEKLPALYDQIAESATRMAVPLNNLSGKGKMEAIKEVFEGLAGSAATLKSMGFIDAKTGDASVAIATISTLVQSLGKDAKTVSSSLDAMFAALEGKGKQRQTFFDIIDKGHSGGPGSPEEMIDRMIAARSQLLDAAAKGELGVRPQQFETLTAYLGVLEKIKASAADVRNNSKGMLDTIATAQMALLQGQTDRLRASIQQFSISLGKEFIPMALGTMQSLDGMFNSMTATTGAIATGAKVAVQFGLAILTWQGITKVTAALQAMAQQQTAAAITTGQFGVAESDAMAAMAEATTTMQQQQAALDILSKNAGVAAWEMGGFAAACAKAKVPMADVITMAGTNAVTGFGAMATAVRGAALSLLEMAGPLLAIQQAMAFFSTFSSKGNEVNAGLDLAAIKGAPISPDKVGRAIGFVGSHSFGAAFGASKLDSALNNEVYSVEQDKTLGPQARALWTNLQEAQRGKVRGLVDTPLSGKRKGPYGFDFSGQQEIGWRQGSADETQAVRDESVEGLRGLIEQYEASRSVKGYSKIDPQGKALQDMLAQLKKQYQTTAGAAEMPQYGASDTGKTHVPTTDEMFRHQIDNEKAWSQAYITDSTDMAEADNQRIESLKKVAEAHGWTGAAVKELANLYKQEAAYTQQSSSMATHEAHLMDNDLATAKKRVAATQPGTQAHEQAVTNLRMVEVAWVKAQGAAALYLGKVEDIRAAADLAIQTATVQATLSAKHWGANGLGVAAPTDLASYRGVGAEMVRTVDENKQSGGVTGMVSAIQEALPALNSYRAELQGMAQTSGVKEAIKAISDAIGELNGKLAASPKEFAKLQDSADNILSTALDKTGTDAAGLLGDDKKQLTALKAYLDGLRSITEQRQKLQDILDSAGNDPAIIATVTAAQQQLNVEQQMLPMLEKRKDLEDQIAQIRKSAIYTSIDTSTDKTLTGILDNSIKQQFDVNRTAGNRITFGNHGTSIANESRSGGVLSGFAQDLFKTSGADWAKQVSGTFTDWITKVTSLTKQGESDQDKLKDIYTAAVKGQTDAANTMLQASQIYAQAAGIGPGGASVTKPTTSVGSGLASADSATHITALASTMSMVGILADVSKSSHRTANAAENVDSNTDVTGNTNGVASIMSTLTKAVVPAGSSSAGGGAASTGKAGGFFGSKSSGFSDNGGGNFASAMQGVSEGSLASSLFGSNGPWGQILGGVGGAAFGPVGGAIGGLIGGLFGNHETQADMPEIYNPAYGPMMADLTGKNWTTASGPNLPTAQFDTYLGHQSQLQEFAGFLDNPTNISNMPPELQQIAQQMTNLETNGQFNNPGEYQGQLQFGGGKNASVTDFQVWAQEMQSWISQSATNAIAPIIGVQAYGSGGQGPNPYNTPGMNAAELAAEQATAFGTKTSPNQNPIPITTTPYVGSPYATPGVGTSAPGATASTPLYTQPVGAAQTLTSNITVMLDGAVVAKSVTAQQVQTQNVMGQLAA
jgi:hypothetical protein